MSPYRRAFDEPYLPDDPQGQPSLPANPQKKAPEAPKPVRERDAAVPKVVPSLTAAAPGQSQEVQTREREVAKMRKVAPPLSPTAAKQEQGVQRAFDIFEDETPSD